jgi:hypothetical protein
VIGKFFADAVGFGEIFGFASGDSGGDQLINLGVVQSL